MLTVTQAIRDRFGENISLHWYEWQQGPDPDPAQRYRFDTHYPDYLPPRGGAYFGEARAVSSPFRSSRLPRCVAPDGHAHPGACRAVGAASRRHCRW